MAKKNREIDPRDIPNYTYGDVARYLGVPACTVRAWASGTFYKTSSGRQRFESVIERPRPSVKMLSFTNLVEIHVLSAIRRTHRVSLQKLRQSLQYIHRELPTPHPLAKLEWRTDQTELFIEVLGRILNVSGRRGQVEIREVVEAYLDRIERDESGLAARFYPFTRAEHGDRPLVRQPKIVVIDPRVSFGVPVLVGTGIPTRVLAERFIAGETIRKLAEDYRCKANLIEAAIRCEQLAA
jgi:uncharacterized protein (DUF433 family)